MLRRERAFTLVELLVSLTAGLLIALAVVAVARGATSTFHEEMRLASAESSLRIAMDRLRADLQRVPPLHQRERIGERFEQLARQ